MSSSSHANHSHYFSLQPLLSDEVTSPSVTISLHGKTLKMATGSGTFSKGKLDAGSRFLVETILKNEEYQERKLICDLGCGWGAVGCSIAAHHQTATICMCDVNPRAVQLTKFNVEQNHLGNAYFWCGNGLDAARTEYFDLILCNPPIRAGNATIGRMFDGAYRCLSPGGVLCIVIRTAQGAKSWQKRLRELFGNCETLAIESGYRILQSTK